MASCSRAKIRSLPMTSVMLMTVEVGLQVRPHAGKRQRDANLRQLLIQVTDHARRRVVQVGDGLGIHHQPRMEGADPVQTTVRISSANRPALA